MDLVRRLTDPLLGGRHGADSMSSDGGAAGDANPAGRQRFNSRGQFLFAAVGFAVGIGNVWRFPYVAYDNGGAAFLFPYALALFTIGVPLVVLELLIGQLFQMSAVHTWHKIHWRFTGIGFAGVGATFLVGLYYNILLAWSLVYMFRSFSATVPWADVGSKEYFYEEILGRTNSISELGTPNWEAVAALAGSWIFVFLSISRGVKGSGKVSIVTVTLPYLVLITLLIRGVTLPGAGKGLEFLFSPDWSQLATLKPWVAAAQQILFSTSPCFGILITFGSFLDEKQNLMRDGLIIAAINSFTSLLAGIAVFSILGFLAGDGSVADVAAHGPELAFVVFPEAIGQMSAAPLFAILFFLMLFMLGIDSVFAWMETVNDVVHEMMPHLSTVRIAATTCAIQFLFGCWFTFGSGIYWLALFDRFVIAFVLFMIGAAECYAIAHVYGMERFVREVKDTTGLVVHRAWQVVWMYVLPAILCLLLLGTVISEVTKPFYTEPGQTKWAEALGWCLAILPVSILLVMAVRPFQMPEDKAGVGKIGDEAETGSVRAQYTKLRGSDD